MSFYDIVIALASFWWLPAGLLLAAVLPLNMPIDESVICIMEPVAGNVLSLPDDAIALLDACAAAERAREAACEEAV